MSTRRNSGSPLFLRKLDHDVSKSTVLSIKRAYLEGMKENRATDDGGDLAVLPEKKRGR